MGFRPPCLPKKECTTDHDIQALPPDPHSSYTFQTPASMVSYSCSLDNSSYPRRGVSTSSKDDYDDDEISCNKTLDDTMTTAATFDESYDDAFDNDVANISMIDYDDDDDLSLIHI